MKYHFFSAKQFFSQNSHLKTFWFVLVMQQSELANESDKRENEEKTHDFI